MASDSNPVDNDEKRARRDALIRLTTISCNEEGLWPTEQVEEARSFINAVFGRQLTLYELSAHIHPEYVVAIRNICVAERRLTNARIKAGSDNEEGRRIALFHDCHLCNLARDEEFREKGMYYNAYLFGLAKNVKTERTWGEALAALAFNIITVPLGFVTFAGPGKKTTANIVWFRLVLCDRCAAARRGRVGLHVTYDECRRHPSWQEFFDLGYTVFLSQEELMTFTSVDS